jgi:hypothetical protein
MWFLWIPGNRRRVRRISLRIAAAVCHPVLPAFAANAHWCREISGQHDSAGAQLNFRVIEGGRATANAAAVVGEAAVRAEAVRRLRESGCEAQQMRAMMTGSPLPPAVRYLQLQIEYAAAALSSLPAVPPDFRSDRYWPQPTPRPHADARR